MAGTTPKGLPYPSGTDPVKDGAGKIEELATRVDNFLVPNVMVRQALGAPGSYTFNNSAWTPQGNFSFPVLKNQTFLLRFSGIARNPYGATYNVYLRYRFVINNTTLLQSGVNPAPYQYATISHTDAWVSTFDGTVNGYIELKSDNGGILHNKSWWDAPQILIVRQ